MDHGGKLFERVEAGGLKRRWMESEPLPAVLLLMQRVFAHATENLLPRGLSAAQGGFLLLLFFVRQRKVKMTGGCQR